MLYDFTIIKFLRALNKYFYYLYIHKKFIWNVGKKYNLSFLQRLLHDWDKYFDLVIVFGYSLYFYYDGRNNPKFKKIFKLAKQRHYDRSPHHWEHWYDGLFCRRMDDKFIIEMLVDWISANLANGGDGNPKKWFYGSLYSRKMFLHPETENKLKGIINEHFTENG